MAKHRFKLIKKTEQGFTLIEILVVVLIIGVLASIAIPVYLNQQKDARAVQVENYIHGINTSLSTEKTGSKTSSYPSELPDYHASTLPESAQIEAYHSLGYGKEYCLIVSSIGLDHKYYTNQTGIVRQESLDFDNDELCSSDGTVHPIILSGILDEDNHAILTWNNIPDSGGYILKSLSGDNITAYPGDPGTENVTFTTVSPLTQKTVFVVTPRNENSKDSNKVSLMPTKTVPIGQTILATKNETPLSIENHPPAVNSFEPFTPYYKRVTLYWNKISDNETYNIYKLSEECPSEPDDLISCIQSLPPIGTTSDLEFDITTQLNTKNNRYVVVPTNSLGRGEPSNIVSIDGPEIGSAYLWVTGHNDNSNWTESGFTYNVNWTRVPGAESYQVYVSSNNGVSWVADGAPTTSLTVSRTASWTTNSQTLTYYVKAITPDSSQSDYNSNRSSINTLAPPLSAPTLTLTRYQTVPDSYDSEQNVNATWTDDNPINNFIRYEFRHSTTTTSALNTAPVTAVDKTTKTLEDYRVNMLPAKTSYAEVRIVGYGRTTAWVRSEDTRPILPPKKTKQGSSTKIPEFKCEPGTSLEYRRASSTNYSPLVDIEKDEYGNKTNYTERRIGTGKMALEAWETLNQNTIPADTITTLSGRYQKDDKGAGGADPGQILIEQYSARCSNSNNVGTTVRSSILDDESVNKTAKPMPVAEASGYIYASFGETELNSEGRKDIISGIKIFTTNECSGEGGNVEYIRGYKFSDGKVASPRRWKPSAQAAIINNQRETDFMYIQTQSTSYDTTYGTDTRNTNEPNDTLRGTHVFFPSIRCANGWADGPASYDKTFFEDEEPLFSHPDYPGDSIYHMRRDDTAAIDDGDKYRFETNARLMYCKLRNVERKDMDDPVSVMDDEYKDLARRDADRAGFSIREVHIWSTVQNTITKPKDDRTYAPANAHLSDQCS